VKTVLQNLVLAVSLLTLATAAGAQARVVAYAPNWGDVAAFAEKIDFGRLTQINVAFENPSDDTGALSFHPQDDILIAKAHASKVQVLVSIGGGGAASNKVLQARYFALIAADKRAAFAASLADYVAAHNFDGLDVDIEGPSINGDYGLFIDELSKAMKAKGKLLTAALSQGYGGDKVPASVFDRFDYVNIMAYDGTGPWNPDRPGQHSSLEMARRAIDYWSGRGLPRAKSLLGVPFYGYGFGDAFRKGDYPYSEIVASHPGAESLDQTGSTIWYNGIPTIRAKAQLALDQGLAGVMIWSLDSDARGEKSLLSALYETLHAQDPSPKTQYPLGPDSLPHDGVPKGKLEGPFLFRSKALANTVRKYWIFVPAQYDAAKPACVLVFQDGQRAINPNGVLSVPTVMENLIARKEMPVTIGIFITPGQRGDEYPDTIGFGNPNNRSVEYDSLGDAYARFLVDELLPEVGKKYNLSPDPERRAIGGASSGAICAWTVAWERPEAFRKVISLIGSFTDLRGGQVYPDLIRKAEPKPIRIFIQDGERDNRNPNNPNRDWHLQNVAMVDALTAKKYDLKYVFGQGNHSDNHGGAILPDILCWMFRDVKE